jgi:hypothetical protein
MHIIIAMSNVKVNDSPNHFMVLDAIARGVKTVDKIAKVTKLDKGDIEMVVNDLATQRLILKTEKKGFLGNRRVELIISHTGMQVLTSKREELQKQWREVEQWYKNGNTAQLQTYMDNNRMWIPMMLFSGIMNAMFFMSMMSLLGMGLSPAESGFAGGGTEGGADSGAGAADDGGAGAGDSGGFDGGDFGGGDFSF